MTIEKINKVLKLENSDNPVVEKLDEAKTPDEFDIVYIRKNGQMVAGKNEDDFMWHNEGYYELYSTGHLGKKLGYCSW